MNWSFKRRSGSFGAALNYLEQDMDGEREGAVDYINIAVNPSVEMQATVDASRELKGGGGAKNERPVFHYTLSWHPDDKPGAEHMMQQARETLRVLGMDQHQAVVKEHRDRNHSHVHIIVNLVNPHTGRTASLSHYKLKLDKWAHEYEAARTIRSPRRAAKHERTMSQQPKSFDDRKTEIQRAMRERREALKKKHQAARAERNDQKDAAWKQFKDDREMIYETHQAELDELWRRKPAERNREPKGPSQPRKDQELKRWAKVMESIAQGHSRFGRGKTATDGIRPDAKLPFRAALARIAAADNSLKARNTKAGQATSPLEKRRADAPRPNLSGKFDVIDERRNIMLPMRNTPEARRYARAARQSRKQRSDEIRQVRDGQVQSRAKLYERDKELLDKRHAAEVRAERLEAARLNADIDRVWADFGREFGLKQREVPEWLARRQAEDRQTIDAARGPATKQFSDKAARPEVQAAKTKAEERRTKEEQKAQEAVDAILAKHADAIPFRDIEGNVRNAQTIDSKGTVRAVRGAPTKGLFHRIDGGEKIVICGSYASGRTIHSLSGATVVVAMDHSELGEVARITREQHPKAEMLIAPDRAEHFTNMGMPDLYRTLGERAANANEATLIAPAFGSRRGQDWHDLAQADGTEAVAAQFETNWRDRINQGETVQQTPAPEQDRGWRDAANGPDWSAPRPTQEPGHGHGY